MRRSGAFLIAAIVGGAAPGAQAVADELVVMPYSCRVIAGQPVLRPSRQEGHSVIGRREQRVFRACSPVNPGLCQQWTVHRFTFDCGGVDLPWVAAVAAAEGHRGGMWIQDGRLQLRMPPTWNMAPDDPCARAPHFRDGWRFNRLRRFCAERVANMPPGIVEMPPGFAPIFDLDAIFVPGPAPQASVSPPNQAVGSWKSTEVSPPVKRPDVNPKVVAPKEPPPKTKPEPETTERPAPPAKPADLPKTQTVPPDTQTAAVIPKIINRKPDPGQLDGGQADTAAVTEPAGGKQPDASVQAFAEPRISADKSANKTVVTGSTSRPESPADPPAHSANPFSITPLSVTTISVVFALFILTAGLAVMFARRREHAELAAMTRRDIASVPLGGRDRGGALTVATPRASSGDRPPAPVAPMSGQPGPTMAEGGRIPQTREEALQVLGMGVAVDAGQTALKKIVDGLRLSWHPDFAVDEADRQARELRLKQINAAWQILAGNRG